MRKSGDLCAKGGGLRAVVIPCDAPSDFTPDVFWGQHFHFISHCQYSLYEIIGRSQSQLKNGIIFRLLCLPLRVMERERTQIFTAMIDIIDLHLDCLDIIFLWFYDDAESIRI